MARFDPKRYPDRLAFEAHAGRIRREEIDKAFHATGAWLRGQRLELAGQLRRFAESHGPNLQKRLTH